MSLPAFAYRWVGGDIPGLQSFESTCSSTASQLDDVDRALSSQVSQVVGDGGWKGSAAQAFASAWDKDSTAGSQLAGTWRKIGSIAGNLARQLALLESQLEEAAYQIEKQGVSIDPANGMPLPDATCVTAQVAKKQAAAVSTYLTYRAEILSKAQTARAQAASDLAGATQAMLPPQANYGLAAAGLDGMRGLWAVPTHYNKGLAEQLAEAEKNVKTTQRAAWQELIEAKKQYGNAARLSADTRANASDALKELDLTEGKLASAPSESITTMLADGDAGGLGATGVVGAGIKGIPYVGTLASAGITTWADRSQGESWGQSISDGAVSSGTALGAGMGTAALIGGGSLVAVGGGVVVGGVVAVGVGDLVHNAFQENWSQDWHDHGVVDGTVDGAGHVLSKTGGDLVSAGKSLVHGIASLF